MPALGAAAVALLVTLAYVAALRSSGGWLCLFRLRTGRQSQCAGRRWEDLATVERGWFYGTPVFLSAAVVLAVLGTLAEVGG